MLFCSFGEPTLYFTNICCTIMAAQTKEVGVHSLKHISHSYESIHSKNSLEQKHIMRISDGLIAKHISKKRIVWSVYSCGSRGRASRPLIGRLVV